MGIGASLAAGVAFIVGTGVYISRIPVEHSGSIPTNEVASSENNADSNETHLQWEYSRIIDGEEIIFEYKNGIKYGMIKLYEGEGLDNIRFERLPSLKLKREDFYFYRGNEWTQVQPSDYRSLPNNRYILFRMKE